MEGDRIFVNVDPPYDYVENKLKENDIVMTETNRQTCTLNAVQSNGREDDSIFAFGGNLDEEKSSEQRALAFGRTASAVFRMVMLKTIQIPEGLWPKFGNPAMSRNKDALEFKVITSGGAFQLLNRKGTKENARECWSRYDQVFPHFLIEHEVLKHKGQKVPFENTMFILRRSAPQVIEITTKAYATMNPPLKLDWKEGEFSCKVEVSCTCKTFDQDEANVDTLNELMAEVRPSSSSRHERRRSSVLDLLKTSSK